MSQFDKKRIKRWRKEVWRIYEREGFKPAELMAILVLCAVREFGTDVTVLVELTGHSANYIRQVLRRLRKQRILSGQTIRSAAEDESEVGYIGSILDAGVAAGIYARFTDPKRSIAQKKRAPETRATGPRRKRAVVPDGAVFTPKVQKSNPLFGLPEWER